MSAGRKPYEPSGDVWREAMERRGGREYTGGPVCWDASNCKGICRECRAPTCREYRIGTDDEKGF